MERLVIRYTGEPGRTWDRIGLTMNGLPGLDLDFTNVIHAEGSSDFEVSLRVVKLEDESKHVSQRVCIGRLGVDAGDSCRDVGE